MTPSRWAALCSILACAAVAPDARADDDEARRAYGLATQAYEAKRFAEAALAFEESATRGPNAIAWYTAALSWEQAAFPERAADAFARALALPDLLPQQRQTAEERLAALERSLATLKLSGPAGARAQVDAFGEAALPATLHAAPGAHVLAARFADGSGQREALTLGAGEARAIEIVPLAPRDRAAQEAASSPAALVVVPTPPSRLGPGATKGTPARVFVGVGIAGVGFGVGLAALGLGAAALDAGSASRAAPSDVGLSSRASTLAALTHVAWVGGAALLGLGLTLALWPSSVDATVALGPGGVWLGGRM